jgi:hypothetical protein
MADKGFSTPGGLQSIQHRQLNSGCTGSLTPRHAKTQHGVSSNTSIGSQAHLSCGNLCALGAYPPILLMRLGQQSLEEGR